MERKGTPFPHLQFMALPHLRKAHNHCRGPKPECSVPPPLNLHFNHCRWGLRKWSIIRNERLAKKDYLLETMDTRREKNRQDLIEIFKMCNVMSRLKLNELFTLDDNIRGTRGHSWKLVKDCCKYFSLHWMIFIFWVPDYNEITDPLFSYKFIYPIALIDCFT